ncbi:MAG TPA: hypothetical protein VFT16_00220 [Candidatus Saccharimonadales bacterium]|nr:hypothetical protein [Candidatus Saccharimonadales bacterium]
MQQDPQFPVVSPLVHQPVILRGLYDPETLFPAPPVGTDSATALVMKTQREAYTSVYKQLVQLAQRYNALLEATDGPIITVDIRPTSESSVSH